MVECGPHSDLSELRLLLVRMANTRVLSDIISENGFPLCSWCKEETNGSQYHRSCFTEWLRCDEEIQQFMANNENDEKEEMSPVRRTTPLSAQEYFSAIDYYAQVAEDKDIEYTKETFNIREFPKILIQCIPETGIIDSHISINRWLNDTCSILMYRLMCHKFTNLIRPPVVEMYCPIKWCLEDEVAYHTYCEPTDSSTVTDGCFKFAGIEQETLMELIKENPYRFFCYTCDLHIVPNYTKWDTKTLGDCATFQVKDYKHSIFNIVCGDNTVFEHLVMHNALIKSVSSFSDDESEPAAKKPRIE
uniref:Uncharacterized protein n=1 Tax=Parvoviridae sp. TaxID=1940570 RepID=A0A893A5S8_9VIRU|nr:MAG: hypothetical protein 1 [Parvoviridae sp.]